MRATLLLCDFAQVADGKLTVVGAGWTFTTPTTTHAVGVVLDVPWDRTNTRMNWALQLKDEDGQPVVQPGPVGDVPVQAVGHLEVGRPAGYPAGTPLPACFAIPVHNVALAPSSRYVWEFSVDGRTRDDWLLRFGTRAA